MSLQGQTDPLSIVISKIEELKNQFEVWRHNELDTLQRRVTDLEREKGNGEKAAEELRKLFHETRMQLECALLPPRKASPRAHDESCKYFQNGKFQYLNVDKSSTPEVSRALNEIFHKLNILLGVEEP